MKIINKFLSMYTRSPRRLRGFTLIEILVVIGIIAVLAAIVIVAINPGRQFAQARNTQRTSDVETILNAIGQNIADNKGIFHCDYIGPLPTDVMRNISARESDYDLRSCLVPDYISEFPVDPSVGIAWNNEDYDSGYSVIQDPINARVTVCAPSGQESTLANSAAICLTR